MTGRSLRRCRTLCRSASGRTSSSVALYGDHGGRPDGRACMNRPRATTSSSAAFSSDRGAGGRAPRSTHPLNGPSRSRERTPHDSSNRYSATSTAKQRRLSEFSSAQQVFVVAPHDFAAAGANRCRSSSPTAVLKASAKTGYAACNPMPIAEPLGALAGEDEKRFLTVGVACPVIHRRTRPAVRPVPFTPVSNWSRSAPSTTARCSNVDRPANGPAPTSAVSNLRRRGRPGKTWPTARPETPNGRRALGRNHPRHHRRLRSRALGRLHRRGGPR